MTVRPMKHYMDHIKLLTYVQHHSAMESADFVYIMALYNTRLARCAIYCLSVIQIGPRI